MDDFLEQPGNAYEDAASPKVDLYQTNHDIIIKAQIPGISMEDVDVYVDINSVKILGEAKVEGAARCEGACLKGKHSDGFTKSIELPADIKADKARAEYRDGTLAITMPKVKPSQGKRG